MRRTSRQEVHELVRQWHPLDGTDPPEEIPSRWNPGHVAFRMQRAFEVLSSMPGRVGPKDADTAWPAILREFSDFIEESVRIAKAGEIHHIHLRYTAADVALADEALCWPLTYLRDRPTCADALQLWAVAKARRRSLRRLLRMRADKARVLAVKRRMRPYQVAPNRVLSDTSMRRYLGPALETLAVRLAAARVPIR